MKHHIFKDKVTTILFMFVIVSVFIMSIGYAAFNTELSISGDAYVRVDEDIRITDLKMIEATNGAYEIYNSKFSKDTISMFVSLPSNDSTITYEVTVMNQKNVEYLLTSIIESSYSNQNVGYEIIGTKIYDYYSGNSNKTFQIKIFNKEIFEKQDLTLQLQLKYEKEEAPTIAFKKELPSSYTLGDDYPIDISYTTGVSGGNASCKSTGLIQVENIVNLNQLTKEGNYIITCTVNTNSGRSTQISRNVTITYQIYTVNNTIIDSGFENNGAGWEKIRGEIVSDNCYYGKCLYLNDNSISTVSLWSFFSHNYPSNHKYYIYLMTKGSSGSIYVTFSNSGTGNNSMIELNNLTDNWIRNDIIFTTIEDSTTFQIGSSVKGLAEFYLDNLMVIDLTETFGSGNEPDLNWCKKHISYFENSITLYK